MQFVGFILLVVVATLLHAGYGEVKFVKPKNKKVNVNEGGTVTLECTTPHDVTVEWLHKGFAFDATNAAKYAVTTQHADATHDTDTHQIQIKNVAGADGGSYRCRNVDDILEDKDDADVKVTRAEALVLTEAANSDLGKNEGVNLICSGPNDAHIQWYYNYELLESDDLNIIINSQKKVHEGKQESHLRHANSEPTLSWTYFCRDRDANVGDSNSYEDMHIDKKGEEESAGKGPDGQETAESKASDASLIKALSPWLSLICLLFINRNLHH